MGSLGRAKPQPTTTFPSTEDQWLNQDLLAKFRQRPDLLKLMEGVWYLNKTHSHLTTPSLLLPDPMFAMALKEMQTNPAAAKAKYAKNEAVWRGKEGRQC